MDKSITKVCETFEKAYGKEYEIEVDKMGFVIRHKYYENTYINVTLRTKIESHLEMIQVSEETRKKGIGTKLFGSAIFVLKGLNFKILTAHVTNIDVIKIVEKYYPRDKLLFFTRSIFGSGKKITYQEAINSLQTMQGFILLIEI